MLLLLQIRLEITEEERRTDDIDATATDIPVVIDVIDIFHKCSLCHDGYHKTDDFNTTTRTIN